MNYANLKAYLLDPPPVRHVPDEQQPTGVMVRCPVCNGGFGIEAYHSYLESVLGPAEQCPCRGTGVVECAPVDYSRKDADGLRPAVARKQPDPAPGPGDRCSCGWTWEKSGVELGCPICDDTNTIQPPGDGTPPGLGEDYLAWSLVEWETNESQYRWDEYYRREKTGACWALERSLSPRAMVDIVRWYTPMSPGLGLISLT